MNIKINDATISHRYKDDNGFLIIKDNPIAKAGVFDYLLSEIVSQVSSDKDRIVKVCRTFDNLVENKDKFSNMPLKLGHYWVGKGDDTQVDGAILSDVRASEPYLIADLIIYNSEVIDKIESGEIIELSPAYEATFVSENGTYNGEPYEYLQLLNNVNHLAVVKEGRSGSDLRILDTNNKELKKMKFKEKVMDALKKVFDEDLEVVEKKDEVSDDLTELANKILEVANGESDDKVSAIVEMIKSQQANDSDCEPQKESVADNEPQEQVKDDEIVEKVESEINLTPDELAEIIEKVTDAKVEKLRSVIVNDNKAVFKAYDEVRSAIGCDFKYQDKDINEIYKLGYETLSNRKLADGMDAVTAFKAIRDVKDSKVVSSQQAKVSDSKIDELLAKYK